ncbi:DNA polymerase III subunit delta [Kineosporia sp. J2-2]|uniref:DNA-directed DNA polymerase n=1 Tax=Kineosporia corallincola TaxID=2835133 RepID=A0ABS5TI88_9ACTN|nr:DNA polymerase III subunit delta [Kineosporia corallincola]MBT0770821.1 DNA polymerase III subunit delta [Kineosporia corallincola]
MAAAGARSRSTSKSASKSASKAKNPIVGPDEVRPAPVLLVVGAEGVLADRAVSTVLAAARAADPETEVERMEAAGYLAGKLSVATSPSLFGGGKVVVLENVEQANEALVTDVTAYLRDPAQDACVVIRHSGALRARPLLEAARAINAPEVSCQPITRDDEKVEFAADEFRRGGRKITPAAVRALVDAVGNDLRELSASCSQLMADDETARIDVDSVERYFGGRVEVTGFKVADAAVAGHAEEALVLLRHALATGADPVPLVAAVAMKVRGLAKVSAAGRGSSASMAKSLGMAPWQIDRARRELNGWDESGLATAVMALAEADAAVKGGGRDPVYAVERLVLTVARSRR